MPLVHSATRADKLANGAEQAIRATQRVTSDALDGLAAHVAHSREPVLGRVVTQAETLARRGLDAVREGSQRVRHGALDVSDRTAGYVRDEPMKSLLIAAAAGAAIALLAALLGSSRRQD